MYKTGIWGDQEKERSKKRLKYFSNLSKQKHKPSIDKRKLHELEIKKSYERGFSVIELSEKFNLRPDAIWRRLKKQGVEFKRGLPFGEKHPLWRGGKARNDGYVYIKTPGHYKADGKAYVAEHLLIWEKTYNKKLPKGYLIHHLNGIRDDNRPENLIAMKIGEHLHQTEPYRKRIRELEEEISKLKQLKLFRD